MMKKNFQLYLAFSLLVFFASCIEENPNLVNPPLPSETVSLRLINLANDKQDRKLVVGSSKETGWVGYESISDTLKPPPSDSVTIEVRDKNGGSYLSGQKLRLIRDSKYFLFAASKLGSNSVDTVVTLTTPFSTLINKENAFICFLNLSGDSSACFLSEGCPNGTRYFEIPYYHLSYSNFIETFSGQTTISLIKQSNGSQTNQAFTYNAFLQPGGQYAFIQFKDGLRLLDLKDGSNNAITKLAESSNPSAKLRIINLSAISCEITRNGSEKYQIQSNFISPIYQINVCNSFSADTLEITDGTRTNRIPASFVPDKSYDLILVSTKDTLLSVLANPVQSYTSLGTNARLRAINVSAKSMTDNESLTLSLGARDDNTDSAGFRSGELIASGLKFGNPPKLTNVISGRAPITIFGEGTGVTKLVSTSLDNFESGKTYFIIITDDGSDYQLVSIRDDEENKPVTSLPKGCFVNIVNFVFDKEFLNITIPGVLKSAKLYSNSTLATVLSLNSGYQVGFNGRIIDIANTNSDSNYLVVASGIGNGYKLFQFNSDNKTNIPKTGVYYKRYINACPQVERLSIFRDKDKIVNEVSDIFYGTASSYWSDDYKKPLSLYIYDNGPNMFLQRIDDISFIQGKKYSVIFGGDSLYIDPERKRFSLLLIQEF